MTALFALQTWLAADDSRSVMLRSSVGGGFLVTLNWYEDERGMRAESGKGDGLDTASWNALRRGGFHP